MNLLVINSTTGPDYLADLFVGELISSPDYHITTNHLPPHLFIDWINVEELYGKGHTVFAKLQTSMIKTIKIEQFGSIQEKIKNKSFDKIIYSSIWRNSDHIDLATSKYEPNNIVVLDGEDHSQVLNIATKVTYYKRELEQPFDRICNPISFTYPSYFNPKVESNRKKKFLLAPCVPGLMESYIFDTESSYYQQYSNSYFAITKKKAGWDCMRHYEIIKSGCIPYFPDIHFKPPMIMKTYPIGLQCQANNLFDTCVRNPESIETTLFDEISQVRDGFMGWLNTSATSKIYQKLLQC
jgi:hypothetical protein